MHHAIFKKGMCHIIIFLLTWLALAWPGTDQAPQPLCTISAELASVSLYTCSAAQLNASCREATVIIDIQPINTKQTVRQGRFSPAFCWQQDTTHRACHILQHNTAIIQTSLRTTQHIGADPVSKGEGAGPQQGCTYNTGHKLATLVVCM